MNGQPTDIDPAWRCFYRAVAATCLHPALRSLLVLDATPTQMLALAAEIAEYFLPKVVASPVEAKMLHGFHSEDELWGGYTVPFQAEEKPASAGVGSPASLRLRGKLFPVRSDAWQVLVVPNLAGLERPLACAAVQLIGAETARIERHGCSAHFPHRAFWLGGCASSELDRVRPHLTDRFLVRASYPSKNPSERGERLKKLRDTVNGDGLWPPTKSHLASELAASLAEQLGKANALPLPSSAALQRIEDFLPLFQATQGLRRHLALGRLAAALAALDGAGNMEPEHVDEAGGIIGLATPKPKPAIPPTLPRPAPEIQNKILDAPPPSAQKDRLDYDLNKAGRSGDSGPPIAYEEPAQPESAPPTLTNIPAVTRQDEPATTSLNPLLPSLAPPRRAATNGRGEKLGIRVAHTGDEIAIFPTLRAAAPYQRWRGGGGRGKPMIIRKKDLRAWRRAPDSGPLWVVLLDLTAVIDACWPEALAYYLAQAYVERSPVTLILVGAAKAERELSAESIKCRNILLPRLRAALDRPAGIATPLAHGLQLAKTALAVAVKKGRGIRTQAHLLVITDGRGNVPLEASLGGPLIAPVRRSGIEDALKQAREIARLRSVEITLLAPEPRFAAHIRNDLARALGVRDISILTPHESSPTTPRLIPCH